MKRTSLGLLIAALLAAPAAVAAPSAAPELIRLDQVLSEAQRARQEGRLAPERCAEFLARFRAELAAEEAAVPPSPENAALCARMLARLGEFDRAGAAASQARYDEKDYRAALAEAEAALKRDPANKEALVLRRVSEGRLAMAGDGPASLPAAAWRGSSTRRFSFVAADPAALPYKLPLRLSPSPEPPDPLGGSSPAAPGPLLPLAGAAALGLAAYEVSRSRAARESVDGLDDEHPKPVGRYQRLVAGAVLAGALGAVLYTLGTAVVSAAPVALAYATNLAEPSETTLNEVPRALARVIAYSPGRAVPELIGVPGRSHVFVTAAEDIEGLGARQLEGKLGILHSMEYLVIRFPTPASGLATPIDHIDPQFVGEGLTSGGAREFWIPNGPIPPSATFEVVK